MKKYVFIIVTALFALSACQPLNIEIDESYEKAEITSISVYNAKQQSALIESNAVVVDTENATVTAIIKPTEDITSFKVAVSLSSGAKITPVLSVGLQDFSQPKVYSVTSPNGTITKDWTITIVQ